MANRVHAAKATNAYADWVADTRTLRHVVTRPGLSWALPDLPAEALRSTALSATITRPRLLGQTWRVPVWVAHGNVTLGDYPQTGDIVTIRW